MTRERRVTPIRCRFGLRMIQEEPLWSIVIPATGLVVASANSFIDRVAVLIEIKREAMLAAAVRAGVAGVYAAVFLEFIFHCYLHYR